MYYIMFRHHLSIGKQMYPQPRCISGWIPEVYFSNAGMLSCYKCVLTCRHNANYFYYHRFNENLLDGRKRTEQNKTEKEKVRPWKAERKGLFSLVADVFLIHFLLAVKFLTCIHTRLSVYPFEGQTAESTAFHSWTSSSPTWRSRRVTLPYSVLFFHEFCQDFKAIPQQLKHQGHKAVGHQ